MLEANGVYLNWDAFAGDMDALRVPSENGDPSEAKAALDRIGRVVRDRKLVLPDSWRGRIGAIPPSLRGSVRYGDVEQPTFESLRDAS